jgi:sugar phosphate isomerase/epimerase
MKIGISSYALTWSIGIAGQPQPEIPLDLGGLLALASSSGAEVLQIADNLPLHELPESDLRTLAGEAKVRQIDLEIGTKGLKPAHLLMYLDLARSIGARLVRTLPHDGQDRPDLTEACRRLQSVRADFESADVTLAVENHDWYPAAWLADLISRTGSQRIGVCLDAVNNLGQGESFTEVIQRLGRLTVNFHCKDYLIQRKPTMLGFDVIGCPAGEGMLDLKLASQVIDRPDVSWIIESWLPWQGTVESTILTERDWLVRSVTNLKQFRTSLAC